MMDESCKPMREAKWDELVIPNKIERLREVVKNLQWRVEELTNSNHQLRSHNHLNGELVVPIEDSLHGKMGADDGYF